MNQPDLKKEFKGLCQYLSAHEQRQNPELDDATRAMGLALYRLQRQLREEEAEEINETSIRGGIYDN
jgi:hypothetical protein